MNSFQMALACSSEAQNGLSVPRDLRYASFVMFDILHLEMGGTVLSFCQDGPPQSVYVDWMLRAAPRHSYQACVFGRRCKQGERIREMGLEAGDAIYGQRSCFKASSGDQPNLRATSNLIVLYRPQIRAQQYFLFLSSRILKNLTDRPQIQEERQEIHHAPNKAVSCRWLWEENMNPHISLDPADPGRLNMAR
jgi:hypothetical protein